MRGAVDEYRCDRIANAVLGALCTATADGVTRPLRQADLLAGEAGYRGGLSELLDQHVYPAWPHLVQAYREWQIPLNEMWGRLVTATDQTLTLLAHAEAEAVSADEPGPVDGPDREHPAIRLYLAPVWTAVIEAATAHPLVPSPSDFGDVERRILDTGEDALFEMWRTLGVTVSSTPSGADYLHVADPQR